KILQALHLLALQPAKLLAPPIIRHLAHPDLADCVHHVLALRNQNIDLPQLRNDLFRLVSLPCHCSPPGCQRHTSSRTTSMGVGHRGYDVSGDRTWEAVHGRRILELVSSPVRYGEPSSLQRAWPPQGGCAPPRRGRVHSARDRGNYWSCQPARGRAVY